MALPDLIQGLLQTQAYPDFTRRVELVSTQISWLLLTDRYAYKVKKPLNLGYLDYSTLEKRRYFCQREIELNQRLAAGVYLSVVPVTAAAGRVMMGGRGPAVEYAVKMRRLPAAAMLDARLRQGEVTPRLLRRLAHRLASFHSRAATGEHISRYGRTVVIAQDVEENFTQTAKYAGTSLSREKFELIREQSRRFIAGHAALFQRRIAAGRIRDCHGDLRAEHICIVNGISIYDCIEFNDRFRYSDVAADIAFLAMDLDHQGRADLARRLIADYITESGDGELARLLRFYKCYRAYVRGKVESFKMEDADFAESDRNRARGEAAAYFDLAAAYTRDRPLLLITAGLVGTGKSTVARELARRLGLVLISSDVTRKQLAGVPLTEHRTEGYRQGIYADDVSRKTYQRMLSEAGRILREGGPVILDATFSRADERGRAGKLARDTGADFFIVECRADEAEVKRRLAARLNQASVSDAGIETYERQKEYYQPVTGAAAGRHIELDTSAPSDIGRVVDMALGFKITTGRKAA